MVANRPTIESTANNHSPYMYKFLRFILFVVYLLNKTGRSVKGIRTNSAVYSVRLLVGTLFPDYGYVYFYMHRISNKLRHEKTYFSHMQLILFVVYLWNKTDWHIKEK